MDRYEIIDMIDEGAYGIVWKATSKESGALVAIKQFKEGDDDEMSRKSIQREIRMLKMLKSEYIVNIKQAFKKRNKVFLIFEYFPKNLLNVIEIFERGLESNLINKIIYKLIKCLRFLHNKNIMHRDIKPENILLNDNATILKLCDFGFARFLPERNQDLTEYVATRWYRSPQLLVGDRYGKASDIWAVGCILGELVDSQPMFPGENEVNQLYLIRKVFGQLPDYQIQLFNKNPKFSNLSLKGISRTEGLEAKYIGKVDKKALSFMKTCLILDPSKRITVEEALVHPYLIELSRLDNEHINDETNILYTNRKLTQRSSSNLSKHEPQFSYENLPIANISGDSQKLLQEQLYGQSQSPGREKDCENKKTKNKFFEQKESLKVGGGSLPEDSVYKVLNPVSKSTKNGYKMQKKYSQITLKADPQSIRAKLFKNLEGSPKIKQKKTLISKISKVMSEEKKINYNIDVKLNINVKINERLRNGSLNAPTLFHDAKLPEIGNTHKALKYKGNNKYPGAHLSTIYNSFGNLSILGESKQLSKGGKKIA